MKKYASFQIDAISLDKLDQIARNNNTTRSQLLRDLVEKLLNEQPLEVSQAIEVIPQP